MTLDACGLSCPEPAMLTRSALLQIGQGTLEVRLDSTASRENVSRMAHHLGWRVACHTLSDGTFQLTLTK